MNKLTHLLSLHFELRGMIWTFCSSDQDSNGLLRCCHQTRDEFSPHCRLTEDVEKLRTLQIWVDSTYEDGIWLKFDYTWGKDGHTHRAISQVRDMDDPIIQMFLKIRQVDKIVVKKTARPNRKRSKELLGMSLTQGSCRAYKEALDLFWANALLLRVLPHQSSLCIPAPTHHQLFVVAQKTYPQEVPDLPGRFVHQERIAEFAAVAMTIPRCDSCPIADPNGVLRESRLYEPRRHWPHIYYDKQNLMSRFQFCLDNLPGPISGHMDMLRLHRFKTMNKCTHNLFARQNNKFANWGGLYDAATEMSRRQATLFNPFATDHVIMMRQSSHQLRAVKWATATDAPFQEDDTWLQYYPKGIRYHWGGRNLVEWRLHWRTQAISRADIVRYDLWRWGLNTVRLHQWWECKASYQDSGVILNQLALPREREALQRLLPHAADSERPVLIRRDREECIYRQARRGCGYTASDFCSMAWSRWRWAEMAGKETFYTTYREGLPGYFRNPDTEFYGPNGEENYRGWFLDFKGVRD
ncbi:unnamed protein product [Fusarium equiseti]|uniref:Uncharacterized protein n=1 Tax=Fusarium equiseti TaxID=61235 RepID=A0A8J2IR47_FUSEQ|nr:unnamed protein product [Fusarium equiseti]